MRERLLARAFAAWATATIVACSCVHHGFAVHIDEARPLAVVASVWSGGQIVERVVLARAGGPDGRLDVALAVHPAAALLYESIVGGGPVLPGSEAKVAVALVPGRAGVWASLAC